ncbi:DUF922 domain-containing protein [Desulforhopalus sp. 52FAK]
MNNENFLYFLPLILFFLFSIGFTGCARLPDYAQPHMSSQPFDPALSYFSYRPLKTEDFQATQPAPSIGDHKHMINAHTSLSLRPVHDIRYIISPPEINFGLYKAYLQELGFRAVMVPERSWWNPQLTPSKTAYVLQHEQIHFALMEIAARRLNRKLASMPEKVISAPHGATVVRRLQETIDSEVTAIQAEILEEHTAFDKDTSLFHDPLRQQQWYDNSQDELYDLSKWAR